MNWVMSILEFENKLNKYRSMIDSSISDVYNDGPISLLEPINHVFREEKDIFNYLKIEYIEPWQRL